MRSLLALAIVISVTAACSPNTNRSLGSIQFNAQTEPFPQDYKDTALRYVSGRRGAEDATLMISQPETLVGLTAFDPMRWYSCVIGLPSPRTPPVRTEPLVDKLERVMTQADHSDAYQIIVMMRDGYAPYVFEAYGSRLCRDRAYEPL